MEEAYKLNQKAYAFAGCVKGAGKSFVSADKANVVIETVKHAEDGEGVILRMYECENSLTKTTVTFGENKIAGVTECNLMEEPEREIPAEEGSFTVTIKPYEVKTYKVRLK